MKIKATKLFAVLLAVVLAFGAVAVAASAENSDPYVKISSIVNAAVGAKNQEITVSLSPDTTLTNAKLVIEGDDKMIDNVSAVANKDVSGVAVAQTKGEITIDVTSAVNSTTSDLTLVTISFDFESDVTGAVELEAEAVKVSDDAEATINGKAWGASFVIGEKDGDDAYEIYKDMVGIGLKGCVETSKDAAPVVDATVVITFKPFEGSTMAKVDELELEIPTAIHGTKGMSAKDIEAFLEGEDVADKITDAVQNEKGNEELTAADFEAKNIKLNGESIPSSYKYDEKEEYVYTVELHQLPKVDATLEVVFRSAMDSELYHGSNIPNLTFTFKVNVGATVYSQAAILAGVKDRVVVKNETFNNHIINASEGKYDLDDFVLDETVVGFNGSKLTGSEKYSADPNANVFTVYFDQINVPKNVLMATADALSSIDYGQFVDAQVLTINEAIGAFQAFCDSLVNAEWPSAEDVEESEEEQEKDDSTSPSTGSVVGLSSVLVLVAAASATAVAIVRKKED